MEQKKSSSKDYRRQSPQYFLIGLIVALSTTLLAFEYQTPADTKIELDDFPVYITEIDDLPPITLVDPVKPPPPPIPVAPVPSPDPFVEPNPEPVVIPEPKKPEGPVIIIEEIPEPVVVEDTPFTVVEEMPEFPGGEAELYAYLGKTTQYPNFAQDNSLEAKLYVQFIVNKDGSISNVKVLNPKGYGFDKEAERVIAAMPKWKAGKQRGRKVSVYYVIPIIFALK